jgi:hypothetical protein
MSDETRILAGILLLSLVTVETGGLYLLKLWRSSEGVTQFQVGFARAGHAHAGVLLVLYHRLPLGARHEAAALLRTHEAGFAESLQRFDFARARFHASQLEYLAPDDPVVHGGLLAKTEVLREGDGRCLEHATS